MSRGSSSSGRLEELLAAALYYGSWLATATIGLGLLLALIDLRIGTHNFAVARDMRIATVGIAMLILLPVLRVVLMLFAFLGKGEYLFGVIAALVLAIIVSGFALGLAGSRRHDKRNVPTRYSLESSLSSTCCHESSGAKSPPWPS